MDIKLADKEDICNVTALRMMYLKEAYGGLTKEEEKIIQNSNVEYLKRSLNRQCFIVFATHEGTICSCAYLNIMEKAANLRFTKNQYGEIYGVYTLPEYRKKGIATELIKRLLIKGKELHLPFIELDASEDGYHIYQKIGFKESCSSYKAMKYILN